MIKVTAKDIALIFGFIVCFCLLMQSWHEIVSFIGIVITAIMPLVLGVAIAYVVAIPTKFMERHFLPDYKAVFLEVVRRPICLVITVVLLVMGLALSSSVLFPALIDTVVMVQKNGQQFVEDVIQMPAFSPVRNLVHDFITGDFVQDLQKLDIEGLVKNVFGGTVGSFTTQLFTMVSTVMTGFFGMLFSFILLTDTTNVGDKIMGVISVYLGDKRTMRFALVLGVADASFHNFIVRQCIEALILGTVSSVTLLVAGFPYALGVGALMGLAALVPIVGYPVGLFAGAFMVAIYNVWVALLYIACVATAQLLEATFVLPHVGDPRTVLPPVWITVGVTIGGGVAGFVGMLVAIPIASTIYQLIKYDISRRRNKLEAAAPGHDGDSESDGVSHVGKPELAQGLVDDDGSGI